MILLKKEIWISEKIVKNEKPLYPLIVAVCYPFLLDHDFPLFIGSVYEVEYWPNSQGEICTLNNANGSILERFYRQSFEYQGGF